jgi:hypothetical protein
MSSSASLASKQKSSPSVEELNQTAGFRGIRPPTTEAGAKAIIEKIGTQIWTGLKSLVTAQNNPHKGLATFNVRKIFKNLPYYQPFIDKIIADGFYDNEWTISNILEIKSFHMYEGGVTYTPTRLVRLIQRDAPQVIVILHKVFTFMKKNLSQYSRPVHITAVLAAIQPLLAEATRKVDNMNLLLVLGRRANDMASQHNDANELATNIARLMITRRTPAQSRTPAQGGAVRKTKSNA